jgi:uncharacterized membrane protein
MEYARVMPAALLRFVPFHAHIRLAIAAAIGAAVAVALVDEAAPLRVLVGWNLFAFVLLSMAWVGIWSADAAETGRRAGAVDPGRRAVWIVATLASTFSLFAAIVVLRKAHALAPDRAAVWVTLCLLAVSLSWLLTHTLWALRYAHLYYRDDEEGVGGLSFPGDRPPDAFDFAYFAITIGLCFQTSDVAITSPQIRRSALMHAALSFAYTTAILALALNLAFSFLA